MSGRLRRAPAIVAAVAFILLPATGGAVRAEGGTARRPPCFGAASRDVAAPCDNPALRFRATPSPDVAELQPNAPCAPLATRDVKACAFGAARARARATIGLVGDSHGPAWRAGVGVLARHLGARGLSVHRSSCPFTTAARFADEPGAAECFAWVRHVQRFFAHHREVHTVVLVNAAGYPFKPGPYGDAHAAAVAGYRAALDGLPASVRQVVVVRDNPLARDDTLACVGRALARHRRPDLRCALPRGGALLPDAAADAAPALAGGRGRLIDLSSAFCDEARCYPVVGGVLVFKDKSHLTSTFSASLGPLLTRAFDGLTPPVR